MLWIAAGSSHAQPAKAAEPRPKTIFLDSDGNLISNNEFVDIRMANFHIPDRTLMRTLEDGTVEFRLQKVPQEGAAAPAFTSRLLNGKLLDSADLSGKVVVLNFWFVGCPSCRHEIPQLNAFARKFAGDPNIEFIAVTYDTPAAVKKYTAEIPFDYKLAVNAKSVLSSFVVGGYPKNIVIGRDGRIVYWRSTIHAWEKFEAIVRAELAK